MEPQSKKHKIILQKKIQTFTYSRDFRKSLAKAEEMVGNTQSKIREQGRRTETYRAAKHVAKQWGSEWGGDLAKMESAIHKDDIIVPQSEKEAAYSQVYDYADLEFQIYRQKRGPSAQHAKQDSEDAQRIANLKQVVRGWV